MQVGRLVRRPSRLLSGVLGFILGGGMTLAVMAPTSDPEDVAVGASTSTTRPERETPTTAQPRTTTTSRPSPSTTRGPELGERRNPYPFGDSVVLSRGNQDYWEVRVLEFEADAAEEVAAENSYNDPPAEGRQFALVTIEVTYLVVRR